MKILLVDDEVFALALMTQQLESLGLADVLAMERATEAVALLERDDHGVDVVLLDLQMPDMDGIEVVRHLARLRFAGSILFVSGEDQRILEAAEHLARAHKLDVLGALTKPVTLQELRARLSAPRAAARPSRVERSYGADELRAAIAGAELVCHFQPQVSMRSGELVGVECLVRWQHPRDGLVYPDAFIGVAEEAGLIDDLTDAVFIEALRHARRWEDSGLPLRLSVNVSMDNLSSLDFPDRVARQLLASGVAARSVVLEVTESRFMKNPLSAIDILARLRLKHVGLSIDDFGTGHSSMTQLRDIPFDELKVDRGFVNGATSSASCLAIVEASLSIVRQLKLRSVAEGVETEPEWRLLRGLGCDVAQGYFIARPMPAEALPAWAQEWSRRAPELVAPA